MKKYIHLKEVFYGEATKQFLIDLDHYPTIQYNRPGNNNFTSGSIVFTSPEKEITITGVADEIEKIHTQIIFMLRGKFDNDDDIPLFVVSTITVK